MSHNPSESFSKQFKTDNAIILAAGFGSRAVPLTYEKPKGLISVSGIPLIERQIEQLLERGISEIIIVVGHLKESFDYLVEKFGVKLIENPEFAMKNNLSSLYIVREHLKNSYIILSDLLLENNIYNEHEEHNWIACTFCQGETTEWCISTSNSKITGDVISEEDLVEEGIIEKISIGGKDSLAIIGPAFFTDEMSTKLRKYLEEYYNSEGTDDLYWEDILKDHIEEFNLYVNNQTGNLHEFESLMELRKYDDSYNTNSGSKLMKYISDVHGITEDKIVNIFPLTSGMTNQSMIYEVADTKYVFRLPGVGTDKLIDRSCEKKTYELLESYDITDEIVHFDNSNGIKISKYYDGARTMNPEDDSDVEMSMKQIRILHEIGIEVDYKFDIAGKIAYYQSICNEINAIRFPDIEETKKKVAEILAYKEELGIPEILCHGDTVYTNLLLLDNGDLRVIDWEYCGAGDPIMDVAMFDIYAYYDRAQIDRSLELYLDRKPTKQELARLYIHVALGGYLWALWTEYKEAFGDNFGDYSQTMYDYLKDYYKIMKEEGYLNPTSK